MGLYAVVFFVARQRFREFGLRIALGAPPREILRLVIGDGMRPAIWGAVLGLLMAIGVGWVMSRLLFGIRPFELSVVLPVLALLAASALAACWFPARWAARVDPIKALRHE
jgi:ABC-type antimicrobial peptide transport system permease subunit